MPHAERRTQLPETIVLLVGTERKLNETTAKKTKQRTIHYLPSGRHLVSKTIPRLAEQFNVRILKKNLEIDLQNFLHRCQLTPHVFVYELHSTVYWRPDSQLQLQY